MSPFPVLCAALASCLTLSPATRAAAPSPEFRIAMVLPRQEQDTEVAFKDFLKRRGISAQFTMIAYSGNAADGPKLVQQLRQLQPELIYTWGTPTTLAVAGPAITASPASFIRDIPIVFTEVTDPVGSGLLSNAEVPGRNVTGVSHVAPMATQIKALRAYARFEKIGYLTNPAEANTLVVRRRLEDLAATLGLEILNESVPLDADGRPNPATLPLLIQRIAARGAEVLYVPPSTFLAFTHRDLVTRSALAVGLPTFCTTETIVRNSDCLFGLFASGPSMGRFAAYKAAQILAEHKSVGLVPAETLRGEFSMLIQMRVAIALKRYPPIGLIDSAEVIPAQSTAPSVLKTTSGSLPSSYR
jgi:putative ABC transport system substrate-binding protein